MSASFTDAACQLAGASSRLLGWPPDWFWQATPVELASILLGPESAESGGITRDQLDAMMKDEIHG